MFYDLWSLILYLCKGYEAKMKMDKRIFCRGSKCVFKPSLWGHLVKTEISLNSEHLCNRPYSQDGFASFLLLALFLHTAIRPSHRFSGRICWSVQPCCSTPPLESKDLPFSRRMRNTSYLKVQDHQCNRGVQRIFRGLMWC